MLLTVVSMAVVLLIWAALWVVFTGYGLGLAAAFHWRRLDASRSVALPFIGYAAVVCLLQLWHTVLPISSLTLAVVSAGGVACFLHHHARRAQRSAVSVLPPWRELGPGWLVVAWLANRSLGLNTLWDSGLYHLPFIKWATTFAIVPGLGNLQDRLAFNNPSLLVHAMLEVTPDLGVSAHLVNGFLCACWVPVVVLSMRTILRRARGQTIPAVFSLAVSVPIVAAASTTWISSTCVEVPVILLSLVGFRQVVTLATTAAVRHDSEVVTTAVGLAFVLFSTAMVIKLSAIFLSLAMMVWLVVFLRRTRTPLSPHRTIIGPAIFGLVLIVVWIIRGIVLSGYPAYPSTIVDLSVPWRVDPKTAAEQRRAIIRTARSPAVPGSQTEEVEGWIGRWLVHVVLLRAPILLLLPMITIVVIVPMLLVARRARDALSGPLGTLAIPVAAAIAAWFCTAPSARFGSHIWWIAAGLALSVAADIVLDERRELQSIVVAGCVVLTLLPIFHQMALIQLRHRNLPGSRFAGRNAWQELPLLTMNAYPIPLPDVTLRRRTTASGLEVLLPEKGLLCWDAPLLCTTPPSWNPRLRLRHPGRLEDGFSTIAPR